MDDDRMDAAGPVFPRLGIGCWSFGGGDYWGDQDQSDVDNIVGAAIELGCTYFDTAEVYNEGRSEASLGKALAGRRDKAFVGTKISPDHLYTGVLQKACEDSLKRLGTDYIDLYMVHWPVNAVSLQHYTDNSSLIDGPPDIREAFAELIKLKKSGKIRFLGVSNFGVRQLAEIAGFPVAVDQMCYNLLTRSIEFEILPHCMERRIQILGYMPLMQGLLTGKYAAIKDIPWQRTRTRHFSGTRQGARHGGPGFEPILETTLSELNALSAELDIPLMQLSLAWAIAKKGVACTINGVRSVEQLHQNVQAVQLTLDPDIINRLDGITEALKQALGSNPDLYESDERSRTY